MSQSPRQMARSRKKLDPLTLGLIIAFVVIAIATALVAFMVMRNLVNSWSLTNLPGAPSGSSGLIRNPQETLDPTLMALPMQAPDGPTPQPWDGASRVNILLLGLDYRDWEAGEIPRTDTMILATVDPINKTLGMLTIPRDMWVNVPGFKYSKINTAYWLGEVYKMPGGGPGMAMKAVEEFLGVPIHYYAQIDFNAFVQFIDHVGGVSVRVLEDIVVDPIGPNNTVELKKGVQDLDGATALAFARMRYTEGDDFDRSSRQLYLIKEIRRTLLHRDKIPTILAQAPLLYQDLSDGIHTNMSLTQAVQLAWLVYQIEDENINQAVIGPKQVSFAKSPDGLDIVIAYPDKIRILRDEIFTTGGPVGPAMTGDLDELVKTEQARIIVQNGTGTAGLATRTSEYFRSLSMNVVEETNADRVYDRTTLVVLNGKPYTARKLAEMMNIETGYVQNRFDPDAGADVIIILGNDWANNNPMP
jgi:polyisoprenyl-teichoic acid--peptidoglycan teichoic acid transferase